MYSPLNVITIDEYEIDLAREFVLRFPTKCILNVLSFRT